MTLWPWKKHGKTEAQMPSVEPDAVKVSDLDEANKTLGKVRSLSSVEAFDLSKYREVAFQSRIRATLSQLIPASANFIPLVASEATESGLQGAFQVVLSDGEQLMKSQEIPGAFRGATQTGGIGKISGQANWVPIDSQNSKLTSASASVNAAMGVMSVVVGQYYMTQINHQLETIEQAVSEIRQFQDQEFLSKVRSTLRQTRKISDHATEIISNDTERNIERARLEEIEADAGQQLDLVNALIKSKLNSYNKFDDYADGTLNLANLFATQQVLVATLREISRLTVLLSNGEVSVSRAKATYQELSDQTIQLQADVRNWHQQEMAKFHVDFENARRKRTGVPGLLTSVASKFVLDYGYLDLSETLVSNIKQQTKQDQLELPELAGYEHAVELLIDGEKIYYRVPESDLN